VFGSITRVSTRVRLLACGALLACTSAWPSTVFAACGDSVVESPIEECDDGNTEAGDCCAADCLFEPQATACGLDDPCLRAGAATCDGQGECTLPNFVFCAGAMRADLWDPGEPEEQRLKARAKGTQNADNIGDPSADTQYTLCIYNYHGSEPVTVDYQLPLPVGEGWRLAGDAFVYRKPKGATSSVLRARVSSRLRPAYYISSVHLLARGSALGLPGPVDSTRYFDVDTGISSVCIVNDLGFKIGVGTFGGGATNRSFVNDPDHVHWAPARLGD